jgi:hypothetical protein
VRDLRTLNLTDTGVTREALEHVVAHRTALQLLIVAGLQLTDEDTIALYNVRYQVSPSAQCVISPNAELRSPTAEARLDKDGQHEGLEQGQREKKAGSGVTDCRSRVSDETDSSANTCSDSLTIITDWEKEGRILVLPAFA